MRNSARKSLQNRTVKSRLHNLEKKYAELLGAGKKEDAAATYRAAQFHAGQGGQNGRDPPGARQPLQIPLERAFACRRAAK